MISEMTLTYLLAREQVAKEVRGDGRLGRKVHSAVRSEEAVHLGFGVGLGGQLRGKH